ncbi:hypothetical protein OH797_38645 (plasmid) [Streptomyces anulatus]|uniref:hypothetical protein n=1 Tax=Streptomyces TaxID=1883 RepID=UPI0006FCE9F0|nr:MULTISPECIES: hypothetical protein [Streptomyces]KQX26804.1 hypothetical protein ASD29_30780 [Streptomyces sp. Root1295]KRA45990.1 hypothetical protein ASD97_37885 [Streptomyces sp. Root63]WSC66810.1 hypothetical protein OHA57_39280 [Streptomyces anulatus]WUC91903.1 hypothetical protein OHQ35_37915 [Streptomyces anulatus]
MTTYTGLLQHIETVLANDSTPEAAAHRSAIATCTQLLDMGYPEDDPIIAKYREGIRGGILTPIVTLYAHTPGFPTAWRDAEL